MSYQFKHYQKNTTVGTGDYVFRHYKVGLPIGYTQLNYVESTYAQYIDTGVHFDKNSKVVMDFITNAATGNWIIFGGNNGNAWNQGEIALTNNGTSMQLLAPTSSNYTSGILFNRANTYTANTFLHIELTIMSLIVNADSYNVNMYPDYYCERTMYICAGHRDTAVGHSSVKVHGFKSYDNGVLTRDMTPAMRNSDSVVGMYDKVNGVFYTNEGTGAFLYG